MGRLEALPRSASALASRLLKGRLMHRALLLGMIVMGCEHQVCEKTPKGVDQSLGPYPNCLRNPDGGLSEALEVLYVYERDEHPEPSADFGCRFEVNGQTLTLVPEGEVCHLVQDPSTVNGFNVAFVSRRCVPPEGTWRIASGGSTLNVTVTDAGVACSR